MTGPGSRDTFRFVDYELDVAAYALRRAGSPVRLERQPMDLLIRLVERRGQLVLRAEIIDLLWGKDVFVDVETGVHTAIRKIRLALRDSPDAPVFVETVPGKGYRFIAPVEVVRQTERPPIQGHAPVVAPSPLGADDLVRLEELPATPAVPAMAPAPDPGSDVPPVPARIEARRSGRARLLGIGLVLVLLAAVVGWGWRSATSRPAPARLAVLPFDNLSADPDREYLADGLAEEMMASLGQADPDRLAVVSRRSVMRYKRTTRTVAEIGRELDADYLVESSIRAEDSRLRITAKLIRVRDQVQVWSRSYNREASSLLGLQQELSADIADQIRLRLTPDRLDALSRRHTQNAAAYDLYLRGQNFANQRTPATTRRAIEYLERATATAPDYALAWSGLAFAHGASTLNSDAPPLEAWPNARAAATRAVAVDPDLAEAQFTLGHMNWILEWNWPAAETALRRALALDPSLSMAHLVLGHVLSQMGQQAAAVPEMRLARELDPLYAMPHALSSQVAFQGRDYRAAIEHARQAVVLDPEFWIGHMMLGQAYAQRREYDRALEALTAAARFSGSNSKALSLRGYVLAAAGRPHEARALLAALEEASRHRYVPPYAFALVHAGLGDRDAVFEWLDRAFASRDVHLIYLTADPKWDAYRGDPRFTALLARCDFMRTARPAGGRPASPVLD